jgi:hypothetical protein
MGIPPRSTPEKQRVLALWLAVEQRTTPIRWGILAELEAAS